MSQRVHVMINREGWYYTGMLGFIVAGAVIRDINLLYIMAGMMLGPLLLNLFLAIKSLKKIEFHRRFPPLVGVGDPLVVEVSARKPAGMARGFAIRVQDRVTRDGSARLRPTADMSLFFSQIFAGKSTVASYRVILNQRGRYRFGPIKAVSSAPVGLIRATSIHKDDDHVLVSPRIGRLLPAWSRRLKSKDEGGQSSMRRVGKSEGDFYGMRDWRNGDSRNWIHWRTSAKRGKLSVRQFEQRVNHDTVVVLDAWQREVTSIPSADIEAAISFTATLAVEHGTQGNSHMLVASNSKSNILLKGTTSPVFQRELLEQLATIEPTTDDGLPAVLADVLPQVSSIAKIIVVTTRNLDFGDTAYFEAVWSRPKISRLTSEIICVNTTARQFSNWFRQNVTVPEPSVKSEPAALSEATEGQSA